MCSKPKANGKKLLGQFSEASKRLDVSAEQFIMRAGMDKQIDRKCIKADVAAYKEAQNSGRPYELKPYMIEFIMTTLKLSPPKKQFARRPRYVPSRRPGKLPAPLLIDHMM